MKLLIVDDDWNWIDNRKTERKYLKIVIVKEHIAIEIWKKIYETVIKRWKKNI